MSKSVNGLISSIAVVRLVTWIMPPHRKGWAHAILNELAYIETRRAAVRWIIGSTLFAIRERTNYELENASMNIKIIRTTLILIAMAVGVVAGTYAIQKPYQQERIKFALHRLLDAKQT
jgi:nitrate reductase gamma subunit